jgi:hypothetical protein
MDGSQFDTLLRGLTSARSRRGAVVGLLGGALGLLGLAESEAKHKKKHYKKKGGGSPPVSPPASPPPPPCVPESETTTCGGQCGTRTNNCGQAVECFCPASKVCLVNGTCGISCANGVTCQRTDVCFGCPQPNTEGQSICSGNVDCRTRPPCRTTQDCAVGSQCLECVDTKTCFPVCP